MKALIRDGDYYIPYSFAARFRLGDCTLCDCNGDCCLLRVHEFRHFIALALTMLVLFVGLIIFEPYRMRRVTSFLDPWEDPFGSGYQLTQSLMAFGRGDVLGQGLGNSVQKLQYSRPEKDT